MRSGASVAARDLLTVPQVHEATRIPQRTLYRWIKTGQLPAFRIGSRYVIHRDDLPQPSADGFGLPIPVDDTVPELVS